MALPDDVIFAGSARRRTDALFPRLVACWGRLGFLRGDISATGARDCCLDLAPDVSGERLPVAAPFCTSAFLPVVRFALWWAVFFTEDFLLREEFFLEEAARVSPLEVEALPAGDLWRPLETDRFLGGAPVARRFPEGS
jgi:hypothetical protein